MGRARCFPECLEDWIDEDNPVCVIDIFVEELDLGELGFGGVDPETTGRPSYHPSVLLKLYMPLTPGAKRPLIRSIMLPAFSCHCPEAGNLSLHEGERGRAMGIPLMATGTSSIIGRRLADCGDLVTGPSF